MIYSLSGTTKTQKDVICTDYLSSKCPDDRSCPSYHCVKPYQWQYQIDSTECWKHFDTACNETLEQNYCDAQTDTCQHKLSYVEGLVL